MDPTDRLKLFGMSHVLLERELDKLESSLNLDLQREGEDDRDPDYYPQFALVLRKEAEHMAKHYEVFYCLEKSIRNLIEETLRAAHGENWWSTCVQKPVQENVAANMQREIDSGMTLRSESEIDFTTFGELGDIVRGNWTDFGSTFSSQKAFTRIMTSLNMLRGPIAHCSPLAADEVLRLQLAVKDWFRLME